MKKSLSKFKFNFWELLIFVCVFVLFFVIGSVVFVRNDEVWIYGFCYNISKGMIIYRDFNVLQTPLYFFLGNLFIKVFGSSLSSLVIFHSFLIALMAIMLFRIIQWKFLIVLPVIMIFYPSGYNLLSLFWIMLLLYLIELKKDNNVLVGIIIGLAFLTKQNIGIILFIPYFIYSNRKIKSILAFCLPLLFLLAYLLYFDALWNFINYCFLGMLEFHEKNHASHLLFVVFEFVSLFYLIFMFIKTKFKDKQLVYIFFFQVIFYPLYDNYHFVLAFFPVFYYFVKNITSSFVLILLFILIYGLNISLCIQMNFHMYREHDMLYFRNAGDLPFLCNEFKEYLEDSNYSLRNDHYYFTEYYGYLFKLYYNIPINQYDFLMTGNVGYNGVNKRLQDIDKICREEKCLFFADDDISHYPLSQWNEFYQYIIKNYHKIDEFYNFSVYTN